MGAGDLELLDVTYADVDGDEPQLKIGDVTSGQAVGQNVPFLASEGFVSLPNPPDNTQATGQVVGWKVGNQVLVIASLDGRYNDKAGTLALGDRAIVSNCDALLYLSQAGNSIALKSTGMALTLDGAGGHVTATNGNTTMQLDASSAEVSVAGGGSVSVGASSVVLQLGPVSLTLDATGVHITTPALFPASGVDINGHALVLT